jgi:hypothetical protein
MADATVSRTGGGGATAPAPQVDVSTITDTPTRRAVRGVLQLNQQLAEQVRQQQMEIEALLHMMTEKHVGSVGEFKRHMMKLQNNTDARSERLHGQIAGIAAPAQQPTTARPAAVATAPAPAPAAPVAAAPKPPEPRRAYDEPEIDRPRRYTL